MNMDPISDMLTRIRNAAAAEKTEVLVPFSKIKFAIAKILEKEKFVANVVKDEQNKYPIIRIALRYENEQSALHSIRRISTPGRRVYIKSPDLAVVLSGFGITILSTSNGLMTGREARARHLGGEVICEVT